MKILKIFNADSALIWTEHFNSENELENWLQEEKNKPYWNSNFSVTTETKEFEIVCAVEDLEKMQKINSAKAKLTALGLNEEEIQAILGL
jgi:hypothetical protein